MMNTPAPPFAVTADQELAVATSGGIEVHRAIGAPTSVPDNTSDIVVTGDGFLARQRGVLVRYTRTLDELWRVDAEPDDYAGTDDGGAAYVEDTTVVWIAPNGVVAGRADLLEPAQTIAAHGDRAYVISADRVLALEPEAP